MANRHDLYEFRYRHVAVIGPLAAKASSALQHPAAGQAGRTTNGSRT